MRPLTLAVCLLLFLPGCVDFHERLIKSELADIQDTDKPTTPAWAREWAGNYAGGDGMAGEGFRIAPHSGIVWYWGACSGSDSDYGKIVSSNDEGIEVQWAHSGGSGRWHKTEHIYFVRWGDRRILVPEQGMTKAVNFYNRTGGHPYEGRGGPWPMACCREEDVKKPITGRLQLPAPWAALLHHEPVHITITDVQRRLTRLDTGEEYVEVTLTLSRGSKDGLFKWMDLYDTRGRRLYITVKDVGETTATATSPEAKGQDPILKPGDELTSQQPSK